eukprot:5743770-Alexandrium_andersonii.AAC.1
MSMRMCPLLSRRRYPGRGCAPSFGAASTAPVPLRPAGGRCALRLLRASGSPIAGPARAAFTAPSWAR